MNAPKISTMQKFGWGYALMFFMVASLAYLPFLTDADGLTLGVFKLDFYDDVLHSVSGLIAAITAWKSRQAVVTFFKIFGIIYGMDGVLGLITGQGYLDGGIFLYGISDYSFLFKVAANIPHIIIGGFAAYIGFVLSKKYV